MRICLKRFLPAAVALALVLPQAAEGALSRINGPTTLHTETREFVKFDAAFDPINQVYLVVWGTQAFGPTNGLFLDINGAPVGGMFSISGGGVQAGWARVVYGGGKFLVSYTKILGFGSHRREVRFVTYQPGAGPAMSSEIALEAWSGGAGGEPGMAYSNGRYLVTWWNWNEDPPQSYLSILDSNGQFLVSKVRVSTQGDGQTDSEIACDSARGRCLIVGQQWGVFNPSQLPGTWGQWITDTGTLIGGGFTVGYGNVQQETSLTFSAAADRFIVAFSRHQHTVYGVRIDAGSRSFIDEYILRNSVQSPEGEGYGRPRIVYNPATQSSVLAMLSWVEQSAVLEVDGSGNPIEASFQLIPGFRWPELGTKEIAPAVDSVNGRMLVADNQKYRTLRSSVFSASGGGGTPPPPTPNCSITFSSSSATFGHLGGSGSFTLTTESTCSWTAASNAHWLTLSSSSLSGTGTKLLSYSVAQNSAASPRTGIIYSGNRSVTVTQAGMSSRVTDLNGDGRNDLILQNHITGELALWRMNGIRLESGDYLSPGNVGNTDWKIMGTLDADLDGHTDILWQHDLGRVAIWRMQGDTRMESVSLNASVVTEPRWRIVGTGDMDRDGISDIIWQHLDGRVAVWYMSGLQMRDSAILATVSDSRWRVAAVEDFNADAKLDILWRHSTSGELVIWHMDNRQYLGSSAVSVTVANMQWRIAAVGDFSGDGKSDLVWQNTTTGELAAWFMDGATFLNSWYLEPGRIDPNWRIAGPR